MRQCLIIYDGEVGREIRSTAKGEASPLGGQLERRDRAQERPDERDIRAGAEDAEYRSGSDTKKGERLLLGTCVKNDVPNRCDENGVFGGRNIRRTPKVRTRSKTQSSADEGK